MMQSRFEALAEAYGADLSRWPSAEREAAAAFLAAEPDLARAALARADDLDAALCAWAPPVPSPALREAVIAGAPRARRSRGLAAWFVRAGLGAGLAAAGMAGVVAGVALSGALPTDGVEAVNAAMNSYDDLSVTDAEGA